MNTPSPTPAVWAVACPRCGSMPGRPCRTPNGTARPSHNERLNAYNGRPTQPTWGNNFIFTTKDKTP